MAPRCFTLKQFRMWQEAARRYPPSNGYCEDCTAQYQAAMIVERRCEHPTTSFERDEDGFESGVRWAA